METLQKSEHDAKIVAVAPRVSLADVEAKIEREQYHVFDDVLTICVLTTVSGFPVTGESACASPENFNQDLGRKFAREQAVRKLWGFEGYLLRERLSAKVPFTSLVVASVEATARVAHEVNRAWCAFLGDESQPSWDDAPEWQRSSAINGVNFHLKNPDAGDSASHDSWMKEKVDAGWVYGPIKDPDAVPPTHPCIVPFDQLPREQQFKDRLFRTIVHAN